MDPSQSAPKKRGCFFYGCLSLVVLFLIGAVAAYLAYRSIQRMALNLTETAPTQLERAELPPEEQAALERRVNAFGDALEHGTNVQELVLNSAEINALLARKKKVADRIFVVIDEDRLTGKLSLPLWNIGPFRLKGRYLNGEATLKASLENGALIVKVDEVRVKGKPLPDPIMSGLKEQNLAADLQSDAETAERMRRFDSITITNGTVVLKNRLQE